MVKIYPIYTDVADIQVSMTSCSLEQARMVVRAYEACQVMNDRSRLLERATRHTDLSVSTTLCVYIHIYSI